MFQFAGSSSWYKYTALSIFNRVGFPIRKFAGQRLLATSPQLIAGCYVLHRLLMSRHPPYTLIEIFPHFYLKVLFIGAYIANKISVYLYLYLTFY